MSSTQDPPQQPPLPEQPTSQPNDSSTAEVQPTAFRRPWQRDWSGTLANGRNRLVAGALALVLAAGLSGFAIGQAAADDNGRRGGHESGRHGGR